MSSHSNKSSPRNSLLQTAFSLWQLNTNVASKIRRLFLHVHWASPFRPSASTLPPSHRRRSLRPRRCVLSNQMCTVESAPLVQLLLSPRAANRVETVVAPSIRDTKHLVRQNQYNVATATKRATLHGPQINSHRPPCQSHGFPSMENRWRSMESQPG